MRGNCTHLLPFSLPPSLLPSSPPLPQGDDRNGESRSYRIYTLAGMVVPVVRGDGLVTVDMGTPILDGEEGGREGGSSYY